MNKRLFFIFLLSLLFLSINLVQAKINTEVDILKTQNGDFYSLEYSGIQLVYTFNTGENISKFVNSNEKNSMDLEQELFCFSDCNIVPNRTINRIDVYKDNSLLSSQKTDIDRTSINQIISIVVDKKINLSEEEISNLNLQPNDFNSLTSKGELSILWDGSINITSDGNYSFILNDANEYKIQLDNSYISQDSINLNIGLHSLFISYFTNKTSKPNINWKKDNDNYSLINRDALIFSNGYIKNIDKSPNIIKANSLINSPQTYKIDYSVYPAYDLYFDKIDHGRIWDSINPENISHVGNSEITSDRIPILLIHGMHGSDEGYGYWNNLPLQLKNADVWEIYYYPANVSNFMTSGLLKSAIKRVLLEGYTTTKVDVVSHSMGGLVTLGYIENLGKDSSGEDIPYDNNIRKYVAISAPLHGSHLSNRYIVGEDNIATCIGAGSFEAKDLNAQAYLDLVVGSEFSWILNSNIIPIDVSNNMLVIAGNRGMDCVPDETKEIGSGDPGAGNDGLVSVASASLIDKNIPLVVLSDYNHRNEIGVSELNTNPFGAYDPVKEGNVIRSFLNNENVDKIRSYLDKKTLSYAGDYYIDPQNSTTNPFNMGAIILKITCSENINSVKLKNKNNQEEYILSKFVDSRSYTDTKSWFYFSNGDSSMSYSNARYGLTMPLGVYQIYANNQLINQTVAIKGAQTTMDEICISNWVLQSDWGACQINYLQYKDWIDTNSCDNNSTKPSIISQKCVLPRPVINSPNNGDILNDRKVLINISVGVPVKSIKYQLDGKRSMNGKPMYMDLCSNSDCQNVTKYLPLTDGNHTLGVIAIDKNGKQLEAPSVSFFIDSTKPSISLTSPSSNSFTNGSNFLVKYNEENLKNISLIFGSSNVTKTDCPYGKNKNCSFNVNLSSYNNSINYYFILTDIAGNSVSSKQIKINVDRSPPVINNLNSFWNQSGKYINFNISINESNIVSVQYIENNKRSILCSSLNKGYCIKKVSFNKGNHNLTIQILDKAGNSIQKDIIFNVEK